MCLTLLARSQNRILVERPAQVSDEQIELVVGRAVAFVCVQTVVRFPPPSARTAHREEELSVCDNWLTHFSVKRTQ